MRERPSSAELSSFFSCRSGVYWKNFHEVKKTKKKRDEKVEDQRAIGTVSLNCLSQYQITNAFHCCYSRAYQGHTEGKNFV